MPVDFRVQGEPPNHFLGSSYCRQPRFVVGSCELSPMGHGCRACSSEFNQSSEPSGLLGATVRSTCASPIDVPVLVTVFGEDLRKTLVPSSLNNNETSVNI